MSAGWTQRLRRLLSHPRASWAIAALALLLLLPALGNGLVLDDYYHREAVQHGRGYLDEPRHPLDLFNFFPAEESAVGRSSGMWPWWSSPLAVSFFRPLSAVTHWLDYALWPEATWLAHLHSLLWCAGLVLVAGSLYRRTLEPAWVAGLATLIFAVDGGHALPASWLASRNMLVSALFGVLSIVWHLRAREQGWLPGRWLSPLALLGALLGAELGVGALGYLIAYAALLTPGAWWRRALTVTPHLVVVVVWQVAYGWLGYGARHAGLYTHPLHAPMRFLAAVVERAPVLLASQLTLPFADVWLFAPVSWALAMAVAAALLLGAMTWLLWPQLKAEPLQRWYALGALLSVVPACATFPNGRMLMFVGLGGAPLLAGLVERVLGQLAKSRVQRVLTAALLVRHTLVAALMLPLAAGLPRTVGKLFERCERTLPGDERVASQTLVVVRTPHAFLSGFAPVWRRVEPELGRAQPARMRALTATSSAIQIARVDQHTLEIRVEGGLLGGRLYQLEWDSEQRRVGYQVDLADSVFEVVAVTADGRPLTFRVRFNVPLEHPSLRWVVWDGPGFRSFEPPPVGETVVLAPIDMIDVMTHLD